MGDAPEVRPVAVGDLGSDRDPAPRRFGADGTHDLGGAGVEAAGDVRRGDDAQQPGVVGDLLAEVGVEVDGPGTVSRHRRRRARGSPSVTW